MHFYIKYALSQFSNALYTNLQHLISISKNLTISQKESLKYYIFKIFETVGEWGVVESFLVQIPLMRSPRISNPDLGERLLVTHRSN